MLPSKVSSPRIGSAIRRLAVLAMLGAAGVSGPGLAARPAERAAGVRLTAIRAQHDGLKTSVVIEASEPVAYVTTNPDPFTILVELRNVSATGVTNHIAGPEGALWSVGVEDALAPDGAPLARVRVTMVAPAAHRVRSSRQLIFVDLDSSRPANVQPVDGVAVPIAAPPAAPSAVVAIAPRAPATGVGMAATILQTVRASASGRTVTVLLSGNGRMGPPAIFEAKGSPHRLVLDFLGLSATAPATTWINQGPVERVRVGVNSRTPLRSRVVIDLAQATPFRVEAAGTDGRDVQIVFTPSGENAVDTPAVVDPARPVATGASAPVPDPSDDGSQAAGESAGSPAVSASERQDVAVPLVGPVDSAQPDVSPAPVIVSAQQTQPQAPQPPAPTPPTASLPPQNIPRSERVFTGHPVSLDFQGADLRAVLRTFAEISGLNLVIDPAVTGSVDVTLRDVPWDQALDLILRANKLAYVVDGTIVRIAPLTVLAEEEGQKRKLAEEQALAGELNVMTRSLSYARAEDIKPLLTRSALTPRGEVEVDARTNTLIIRDLPAALTTANDLINTLDRPQPQVEIEARIVQTNRDFARAIGVQWGITGRVAPELGNTTGLAFPNQGSVTGRTGGQQGGVIGQPADQSATAVNLPAGAASSAIGITLGAVNGALNLDVALSAMEKSGRGRLLSTPRVSTQNNVEAEITQGVQIPIQTVANNTVTVTFKDAALTLKVTPQITAAGTVIMKIAVENATPDFTRSVNNIPPINTQRANTQVLVSDGQTTVIGGIYTSNETTQNDRTPGLHRIPLLGWLFKRDTVTDSSTELLIFITPRIIKS